MRTCSYLIIRSMCLCLLILGVTQCADQEVQPLIYGPYPGQGVDISYIEVAKNGTRFKAGGGGVIFTEEDTTAFRCIMSTFTNDPFLRELMIIDDVPLNPGRYQIESGSVKYGDGILGSHYSTYVDDGDVSGPLYEIALGSTNFIEVSQFVPSDTISITNAVGRISGTFEVHFRKTSTEELAGYPDFISFTDGVFDVIVIEY